MKVKIVDGAIERETEKAVLIDVTIDTATGLKGRKVWFPKSHIEITEDGIFAEAWIIEKKNEEIEDKARENNPLGSMTFNYGILAS